MKLTIKDGRAVVQAGKSEAEKHWKAYQAYKEKNPRFYKDKEGLQFVVDTLDQVWKNLTPAEQKAAPWKAKLESYRKKLSRMS